MPLATMKPNGFLLALLALLAGGAWMVPFVAAAAADCLTGSPVVNSTVDLFPVEIQSKVVAASDFTIEYRRTFKLVTNKRNNEIYVLHQCGAPAPDLSLQIPGAKVFQVPLQSVSTPDSTALGFLEALDLLPRVAYTSTYAVEPCLQLLASKSGCDRIALDPTSPPKNPTLLQQQMQSVDAFFVWSPSNLTKAISFTASADDGALQRVEWIKFMAAFFNKEVQANALYDTITATYSEIKGRVESFWSTSQAKPPVVAWVSYLDYYGPKQAQISFAPYKEALTKDAGGALLDMNALAAMYAASPLMTLQPNNGNPMLVVSIDTAEGSSILSQILNEVDIVIDESYYANYCKLPSAPQPCDVRSITTAMFVQLFGLQSDLNVVQNKKVYRNDGTMSASMGSDWWIRGLLRADLILSDLTLAITPSACGHCKPSSFVRNIYYDTPTVVDSSSCTGQQLTAIGMPGCNQAKPPVICPFLYSDCNGFLQVAPTANPCVVEDCSVGSANDGQELGSSGLSTGAIVGIVLGCVGGALVLAMMIVALVGSYRHRNSTDVPLPVMAAGKGDDKETCVGHPASFPPTTVAKV